MMVGHEWGHPEEARGIGRGERLLIWTWRKIAAGAGDCPLIARDFSLACGEDAVEVFATFCTCLRALAYASRRRLHVGSPGCTMLTRDERQLLTLIAAAQAEDGARFEAHLRWLARAERRCGLAIAARALGAALAAHDLHLSLPAVVVPFRQALRPAAGGDPQPASGS